MQFCMDGQALRALSVVRSASDSGWGMLRGTDVGPASRSQAVE